MNEFSQEKQLAVEKVLKDQKTDIIPRNIWQNITKEDDNSGRYL
jgi:hypothetical protein